MMLTNKWWVIWLSSGWQRWLKMVVNGSAWWFMVITDGSWFMIVNNKWWLMMTPNDWWVMMAQTDGLGPTPQRRHGPHFNQSLGSEQLSDPQGMGEGIYIHPYAHGYYTMLSWSIMGMACSLPLPTQHQPNNGQLDISTTGKGSWLPVNNQWWKWNDKLSVCFLGNNWWRLNPSFNPQ